MYFYMAFFVVCVLEVTQQRSFVGYIDGEGAYMGIHCEGLFIWGNMSDYNKLLLDFIDSSPVN